MVFFRGVCPANVLFIGEAPGADEDLAGHPFVGRSGKVLDRIIEETHRKADLLAPIFDFRENQSFTYGITNTVCCRPPENREPTHTERTACAPRLYDLIRRVNPLLIVAVGFTAGKNMAMLANFQAFGAITIQIYHPAYLLRKGTAFLEAQVSEISSQIAGSFLISIISQGKSHAPI